MGEKIPRFLQPFFLFIKLNTRLTRARVYAFLFYFILFYIISDDYQTVSSSSTVYRLFFYDCLGGVFYP